MVAIIFSPTVHFCKFYLAYKILFLYIAFLHQLKPIISVLTSFTNFFKLLKYIFFQLEHAHSFLESFMAGTADSFFLDTKIFSTLRGIFVFIFNRCIEQNNIFDLTFYMTVVPLKCLTNI